MNFADWKSAFLMQGMLQKSTEIDVLELLKLQNFFHPSHGAESDKEVSKSYLTCSFPMHPFSTP